MNKKELFLKAMDANEFKRRAWVISAFALIKEGPDEWKKNIYSYRIVQTPAGNFFVDPDKDNTLTLISDAPSGEPVYRVKEHVQINSNEVINLSKDIETTYGNLLFNYIGVIYPFKAKIPFMEGRVSPSQMEAIIILRLKDTPLEGEIRNINDIYVDEYLIFCDAMFYLAGFTQLCVPAATRKTMTASPEMPALKARLLAENKDRLHDPAIIAKIDAELVKKDKEWMKGDEGEGFLMNSSKSFGVVRKKLYGMHGAEVGLSEDIDVDLIENSLSQGWDIKKFPAMNNSLRAGSFNRGAQTMLGGEAVKWLLRASSNIGVTGKDCGSRLGNEVQVTGENLDWIIGFSIVTEEGSTLIPDLESAKKYVGKKVILRSPMFCNLDMTDFCATCVGERLAQNPTGISTAISEYGSSFLAIFLKMSHGKALTLAKMNYKTAIF